MRAGLAPQAGLAAPSGLAWLAGNRSDSTRPAGGQRGLAWLAGPAPGPRPGVAGGLGGVLTGEVPRDRLLIELAGDRAALTAYRALRQEVFVAEQGLFRGDDADWRDDDPRQRVLIARDGAGTVLGGVRLGPATEGPDIGWWAGGRLAVRPGSPRARGTGTALVAAACAHAEAAGALRFDAAVQASREPMFARLGWQRVRPLEVCGAPHVLMRWPIGRIAALVAATKEPLGALLAGLGGPGSGLTGAGPGDGLPGAGPALGGAGFVGDDGAPVPGSDLIACCDAIVPSMAERDPEWAGWCSVLVNVNDLAAMGAAPVGLLDAVAARDAAAAGRLLAGLAAASEAYGVPVLGGHTQLGVPAALTVTALGRTSHPVPAGGGRPGHQVTLTADLGGAWRPGYTGRQWDSTTARRGGELRAILGGVAAARPAAAKDVSMAGLAGTLGMLAEASGCAAVLDVAAVPRPAGTTAGDWLTCFPGYAMLTADAPGAPPPARGPAVSAACGELTAGAGVTLRWPDGELTPALDGGATGLGRA